MADNVTNPSNSYISHYSELEIPRTVPIGSVRWCVLLWWNLRFV